MTISVIKLIGKKNDFPPKITFDYFILMRMHVYIYICLAYWRYIVINYLNETNLLLTLI